MNPYIDSITRELRGWIALDTAPAGCELSPIDAPVMATLGGGVAFVLSADGTSWAAYEDLRGSVWHDPDTGAEVTLATLGESVPPGYVKGPAPAIADPIEARSQAAIQIDQAAGEARGRYLSSGVGQELTYQAKYADACAFLRAQESGSSLSVATWPYVAAEAQATGLTPSEAAARIAQIGAYWEAVIGPRIERVRIAGKDALLAIETEQGLADHVAEVVSSLNAI